MEKLEELKNFIWNLGEKAIDFFPVKENFSRPILDELDLKYFKVLGRTLSDSIVISLSTRDSNADWNSHPIAWIDSEGVVNAVFAKNFDDFLSLLYFDTSFIYNTLYYLNNHNQNFSFDKNIGDRYAAEAENNYPANKKLQGFLKEVLQVARPADPVKIIKDAIESYPNFPPV